MAHGVFKASRSVVNAVSHQTRQRRMQQFLTRMRPTQSTRLLDIGGTPSLWKYVPEPLQITIVNLPGQTEDHVPSHHKLSFLEGDGCDLSQFDDGAFDMVFSNSVIEHVGPAPRQADFAREIKRLASYYWVQTPAPWFPIEAHTGMPFWWFYPEAGRQFFLRLWRSRLPAWAASMADTRVLPAARMRDLFPSSDFYVEKVAGIPKSYTAYRSPVAPLR